jgi:hypothetical protein
MSQRFNSKEVFLQIGFRSSEPGGIKTIELFGVPGERLSNGEYAVSEKVQRFFDDLIVRKIFRDSRRLPDCDFQHLKIWLYDMDAKEEDLGYEVPRLDERDLEIYSDFSSSKLERIYVLDNELAGYEYKLWKRTAETLFTPLFSKFLAPPDTLPTPPDIFRNSPLGKFVEEMAEKVDPYFRMRQSVFFNALIIQID